MASLDRSMSRPRAISAPRASGAVENWCRRSVRPSSSGYLRFVIMLSVLSVPLMINARRPTMITADMAFRINAYGDYGIANALGLISYLMTGTVAWIYLR